MSDRWHRLSFLTGLLGVVLIVVAFVALGGNTPDTKDSGEKVLAFYHAHRNRQMTAAYVLSIGAALLIFWSSSLRWALRRPPATGRLAGAAFGGGIVAAAGFLLAASMHIALADSGKYGDATIAHALNLLDSNNYLSFASGMGVMALAAGISVVRTRVLPLWLGIVGIVAGVATFTPAGFFGFMLDGLWVIIASIMFAVRPPSATSTG